MPSSYPYIQYGGIWTTSQATDAVAAGTWAVPPQPYLFGWGINSSGQLGIGTTSTKSSPTQVGALTSWLELSAGYAHTVTVKTDGTLWAWGANNTFGQLGLGNLTSYSSPKQVGVLTNWLKVSAGYSFSAAIKTDGTLWTWGRNNAGQLGLNITTSYSSPKQVGSGTYWASVSCGYDGIGAIRTDGTLWMWGDGTYGQLGLGDALNRSSPTQVGSLTNWSKIKVAGYNRNSVAIKTDGTLWIWGRNEAGQLGLNNTTYYSSPKQVGSANNWIDATIGCYSTLAIKSDGTLWVWGSGSYGQMGLGNTTNYSSPKQIGSLTNWLNAASGYNFSVVRKTDGTLWSWGRGLYGQTGLNSSTDYSSPKQIGSLGSWVTHCSGVTFSLAIAKT